MNAGWSFLILWTLAWGMWTVAVWQLGRRAGRTQERRSWLRREFAPVERESLPEETRPSGRYL